MQISIFSEMVKNKQSAFKFHVFLLCICASLNLFADNSNVIIGITNSCVKSFCGFTFGSHAVDGDIATNEIVEGRLNDFFPKSDMSKKITVSLKRSFRCCTQAQLIYTPYEMRLYGVILKGRLSARLTEESMIVECNKIRRILESQGMGQMKERVLWRHRAARVSNTDNLRSLPFVYNNPPYYLVYLDAFVDNRGTVFQIAVRSLLTEDEDDLKAISSRQSISIDGKKDADMNLFEFAELANVETVVSHTQPRKKLFEEKNVKKIGLLEPLISVSNAVERIINNDPSGYYSLALHFAKGDEIQSNASHSCFLIESAVSNHYANAELVYAMIKIGNCDLGFGSVWQNVKWEKKLGALRQTLFHEYYTSYSFLSRQVSARKEFEEIFMKFTGLKCGTVFFKDIKGLDLTNEYEVSNLKLVIQRACLGMSLKMEIADRKQISDEITALIDELVEEKKKKIEIAQNEEKAREERLERIKSNNNFVASVLGLQSDSDRRLNHRNAESVSGNSLFKRRRERLQEFNDKMRKRRIESQF